MTELELDCLEVDCVENYEYLDWKNVEDKTANDVWEANTKDIVDLAENQLIIQKSRNVNHVKQDKNRDKVDYFSFEACFLCWIPE